MIEREETEIFARLVSLAVRVKLATGAKPKESGVSTKTIQKCKDRRADLGISLRTLLKISQWTDVDLWAELKYCFVSNYHLGRIDTHLAKFTVLETQLENQRRLIALLNKELEMYRELASQEKDKP